MTFPASTSSTSRSIAVIGAGHTGASVALALCKSGFEVTVYSDRDRHTLRDGVPATGTAITWALAQQAEADLDMDTYIDRVPEATGQSAVLVAGDGQARQEVLSFYATYGGSRSVGVDPRLKADERLAELGRLGGSFVVESVDPDRLDSIAAQHDLTLISTGRGGLYQLFPVDQTRTYAEAPRRSVLTLTVAGLGFGPDVFAHRGPGGITNSFSFTDHGEVFWGPYLHKDAGPVWATIVWAQPGSEWERRFAQATDAQSAHDVVVGIHRDFLDWDLPEVRSTRAIAEDPHSWLTGAVRPVTRKAVGTTASGHSVLAIGDAAVSHDPIAGQGAQGGLIQSAQLVAAAREHDGLFDAEWLQGTYDRFLASRVDAANVATQVFLREPAYADIGQALFPIAQVSPAFGSALFNTLSDPSPLLSVTSVESARSLVEQVLDESYDQVISRFEPVGRIPRSEYGLSTSVH